MKKKRRIRVDLSFSCIRRNRRKANIWSSWLNLINCWSFFHHSSLLTFELVYKLLPWYVCPHTHSHYWIYFWKERRRINLGTIVGTIIVRTFTILVYRCMRAAAVITGYQDELNLAGCCGGRADGWSVDFQTKREWVRRRERIFFFGILKFVDRERMFFFFFE
jgi:hypothetical protein